MLNPSLGLLGVQIPYCGDCWFGGCSGGGELRSIDGAWMWVSDVHTSLREGGSGELGI